MTAFRPMYSIFCALVAVATGCILSAAAAKPAGRTAEQDVKPTRSLSIAVSHCALLRLRKGVIMRTKTSAPDIVEPVVVARNELFVVGKKRGAARLQLWTNDGSITAINVSVAASASGSASSQSGRLAAIAEAETGVLRVGCSLAKLNINKFDDIPSPYPSEGVSNKPALPAASSLPASPKEVDVQRYSPSNATMVQVGQVVALKVTDPVTRVAVSDPGIAVPMVTKDQVLCVGRAAGETTLLVWTTRGVFGINVAVYESGSAPRKSVMPNTFNATKDGEVEYWYLNKKVMRKPLVNAELDSPEGRTVTLPVRVLKLENANDS